MTQPLLTQAPCFSLPEIQKKTISAILKTLGRQREIHLQDSLVLTLGFNSLRMVSLSLALEDEFQISLLLNDWISTCESPRDLTVESLAKYIQTVLQNT